MLTDADRKYINEIVWTEDNTPKICAIDRMTAIKQIQSSYQHPLPTEVADAILDRLMNLWIVANNPNANIQYYMNPEFDWVKYNSDQYLKYRYFVSGTFTAECNWKAWDHGPNSWNYNCIVEWDKISLTTLRNAIAIELKKIQKSENDLEGTQKSEDGPITNITIGNLIEVGYPKLKENSNGRE